LPRAQRTTERTTGPWADLTSYGGSTAHVGNGAPSHVSPRQAAKLRLHMPFKINETIGLRAG
jgi:hypothetical protein